MFVIDRVELAAVDQAFRVGDFDYRNAFVFEQRPDACDEPEQIGHVG